MSFFNQGWQPHGQQHQPMQHSQGGGLSGIWGQHQQPMQPQQPGMGQMPTNPMGQQPQQQPQFMGGAAQAPSFGHQGGFPSFQGLQLPQQQFQMPSLFQSANRNNASGGRFGAGPVQTFAA